MKREWVETRNNADNLAYQSEKTIRELGEKLSARDRQNIEQKVDELRESLKSEDLARIQQLSSELQNAVYALNQQLNAQQTQPEARTGGNGNGKSSSGNPEDEVIEGEFQQA